MAIGATESALLREIAAATLAGVAIHLTIVVAQVVELAVTAIGATGSALLRENAAAHLAGVVVHRPIAAHETQHWTCSL